MIDKLSLGASALLLAVSAVAGGAWWWLTREIVSDMPREAAYFLVPIAIVQILSWIGVAFLCVRAWRTHSPWLVWSAPLLALGLVFANALFGFTPVVGAPIALSIGVAAIGLGVFAGDWRRGRDSNPR